MGRRWNIDPILKYYISTYSCLSDNPINRVDRKGNTDNKSNSANPHNPESKGGKEKFHEESVKLRKDQQNKNQLKEIKTDVSFEVMEMEEELTDPIPSVVDKVEEVVEEVWNSPASRAVIPDIVSVGGGFSGIFLVGSSTSVEANWVLRGPDASFFPVITVTETVAVGYSVDATVNIGGTNYLGPVDEINREMIETSIKGGDVCYTASGGLSAGAKVSLAVGVQRMSNGNFLIMRQASFGGGLPAGPVPINFSAGVSNTFEIYDK